MTASLQPHDRVVMHGKQGLHEGRAHGHRRAMHEGGALDRCMTVQRHPHPARGLGGRKGLQAAVSPASSGSSERGSSSSKQSTKVK